MKISCSKAAYITLCLLLSCTAEKEKPTGAYALSKVGEKTFFIDSTTNLVSTFLMYFQDKEKAYLAFENRYENSIQFYDFSSGELAFKTFFEVEGNNGLGGEGVGGFFIRSLDSIFVIGRESSGISLVDSSGLVKKRVKVSPDGNAYWDLIGVNKVPLAYHKGKLFSIALGDFPLLSEPANGQPLEVEIDFATSSSKIVFSFPNIYEGFYGPFHTHPCRTFNGQQLVYSFPITPDLYTFNPETKEVKFFPIPSEFIDLGKIRPLPVVNPETMRKATIQQGIFMEVVYDPYRRLYYRFVLHPTDLVDPSTGFVNNSVVHKPFSIQMIDENFQKLGETAFPAMEYFASDFFVGPEGLYISSNHPNKTDLKENEITFSVFQVRENE